MGANDAVDCFTDCLPLWARDFIDAVEHEQAARFQVPVKEAGWDHKMVSFFHIDGHVIQQLMVRARQALFSAMLVEVP